MCESPILDNNLIYYFINKHPLHRITTFLLIVYYHHVRIMQVMYLDEPVDVREYVVEMCECRLNMRQCNNRIDTCLKKKKDVNAECAQNKIQILNKDILVRIKVNTASWKYEICHCCACCCFPIRIHNLFPKKIIFPSNYVSSINSHLCDSCKICIKKCPFNAIKDSIEVDIEKCLGCGICKNNCQLGAIAMETRENIIIPEPKKLFSISILIIIHIYFYFLVNFSELLHQGRGSP